MLSTHAAHRRPRRRPQWTPRRYGIAAALVVLLTIVGVSTAAYAIETGPEPVDGCRPGVVAELYADGTWRPCDNATPQPGPSPTPSVSPTATPTPSTTPTSSPTTGAPSATPTSTPTSTAPTLTTIRAYITGYSWWDNTPPGSAAIALPQLHKTAGGTGTYTDPITVAVGHSIISGRSVPDWPAGTRFYVPNLRRYLIVEDVCGDGPKPQNGPCHTGYPSSATTWLDVWVGGQGGTSAGADRCMSAITKVSTVVVNPPAGLPVQAGDIYTTAGCTTQYGDAIPPLQ